MFGKKEDSPSERVQETVPTGDVSEVDPAMVELKKNNLFNKLIPALEEYVGRPLSEDEHARTRDAFEKIDIKDMVGDEMRRVAGEIASELELVRQWTPGEPRFENMTLQKQITFEQTLAQILGRPPQSQEISAARAEFLKDEMQAPKFNSLSEDGVVAYAESVADRLGWIPELSEEDESLERAA